MANDYTASATYEDDWVKVHFVAPRSRDQFEDRACPNVLMGVDVESLSIAGHDHSGDEIEAMLAESGPLSEMVASALWDTDPDNWTFDASERTW